MNDLRKYLSINALFSLLSGLVLVFQSKILLEILGLENEHILHFIGFSLIAFALIVFYVSIKLIKKRGLIIIISVLDMLWVFGSMGILLFDLFDLNSTGKMIVAGVAVFIGFLGIKQFQFNKKEK